MNKNRHLISKYLSGELDALTASRFEQELKNDPILQQELELYKDVDEALQDADVMELRRSLKFIHFMNEASTEMNKRPRVRRITLVALAASIAIVLGFTAFNLVRPNKQKVFDKYYQAYELTSVTRSETGDNDRVIRIALEKYYNKEYREAVTLFEKVLEKDPGQMATQLYSGISYYEIAEYQKAGKSFSRVIEHDNNLYIEQAKWYLGFCYIKTEEYDKALKHFTEIAESDSYYREKAKTVIKKLR